MKFSFPYQREQYYKEHFPYLVSALIDQYYLRGWILNFASMTYSVGESFDLSHFNLLLQEGKEIVFGEPYYTDKFQGTKRRKVET
jgi:hypothetical protein